jgi:hypothetical protein
MWKDFFAAGGWGMYPTLIFGFLLISVLGLYVLRGEDRLRRLGAPLWVATIASGVLGTAVGICNTVHYAMAQPREEQLSLLAMGTEESLHNLVLALLVTMVGALIACLGVLRHGRRS